MDTLEQRLTDAGAAWRRSQPEPPELDRLVAGLGQARGRRPSQRLLAALMTGLVVVVVVAVVPRLGGIGGPPDGTPVTLLTGTGGAGSDCRLGRAAGILVADARSGLGLAGNDGVARPIRWQSGYTASWMDGRIALLDPSGNIVAKEGDYVQTGGGLGVDDIWGACGSIERVAAPTPTPMPTQATCDGNPMCHFEDEGLAFDYPASWNAAQFDLVSSFSSLVVYLSTEPLTDPCDRTPSSIACERSPITKLGAGGIQASWTHNGFPGWTFDPAKGSPIAVGGRQATLEVLEAAEGCRDIGGVRELVVTIPIPTVAFNWTQLNACLAGPDPDATQAKVEAMLETVRWTD